MYKGFKFNKKNKILVFNNIIKVVYIFIMNIILNHIFLNNKQ